jgi:2-polyprenyl-3-methyl-5-hydroxy-6-metoxy-1,4-benzoquinol methylase
MGYAAAMGKSFDPAHTAAEADADANANANADQEFDRFAADYDAMHRANIAVTGEAPEYFARYKRDVLARMLGPSFARPLLDFGCGIGNLTCLLAEHFSDVHGYDPSSKSVDIASRRAERATFHAEFEAIPRAHFGAVVLANVLHHVRPAERPTIIRDMVELLARGGRLIVFEHNPLNPLTRRAVRACPFDEGVELLWPWALTRLLAGAGLRGIRRDFIVFFPRALAALRRWEPSLRRLPLGAQIVAWGER